MKSSQPYFSLVLLTAILVLVGCESKKEAAAGHGTKGTETTKAEAAHEEPAEASGAEYEEGKGISLSRETEKSLAVEYLEVTRRALLSSEELTGQIYRAASESSRADGRERQGQAYATALISPELLAQLKPGQKITFTPKNDPTSRSEGQVARIEQVQLPFLGKAEALLALPDPAAKLHVGDFVQIEVLLEVGSRQALVIPSSALLETSTGTYVFARNGNYLRRTEVKLGARAKNFVEVTAGLNLGDGIATRPVEDLYLIELRATKGGGHSH